MRRVVIAAVLSTMFVGMIAVGSEAQRRRGRRGQRAPTVPQSEAIAPALGDVEWGMSNKQLFNHFRKNVRARHQERLSNASDAMQEDAIRHRMSEEVQRIRRSYIRFRGQTTGWDVSFLRDEFTHNNHESMLVVRDGNSQNFYFFINGRLWKWYKAFDAEVFQGQTFEQFAEALQGRFGRALERRGRMTERGQEKHWLEWRDRHTRLRAIDETRFYGFYCLVFEDLETLGNLESLRANRQATGESGHTLVEAVTSDDSAASASNQDVIDRITGRIRRRTDADESSMGSMGMSSRMSSMMRSGAMRPAATDDDPLRGLDF